VKVIIHFGFPKTMSSSLQFGVFKTLHKKGFINLSTWRLNSDNEELRDRPSSRLFIGEKILSNYIKFSKDKINILSDESFTAPVKLRKNNFGEDIIDPIHFPLMLKKQIQDNYGDNIEFIPLIIIRNQQDLIYSQYVEEYNLKVYKGIDLLFDKNGNIDLKGFEVYKYYNYISELQKVFGQESIKCLIFEEIVRDPKGICQLFDDIKTIDCSDIKKMISQSHVNKKNKDSFGYFTKDLNHHIPFLNDAQKDTIRNFFLEDNIKLQKLLNKDLSGSIYNYT